MSVAAHEPPILRLFLPGSPGNPSNQSPPLRASDRFSAVKSLVLLAGLIFSLACQCAAATPPRVAILGDSITFDGRWATRVESALRSTPRFADVEIVNFGLGSETVSGLSEKGHAGGRFPRPCLFERLDRILDAFHPTLVLACYGMNDGISQPLDPARFQAYKDGITRLKDSVEKRGARIIFITPPLHRADQPSTDPLRYDAVLDAYSEWLVSRRSDRWQIIDIRPDLKTEIAAARQADPAFVYAKDGVHPGDEGHAIIAASICTGLWPILKLPGSPQQALGDALVVLNRRSALLKLAWLTKTGHQRPGVPPGLPLDQAEAKAADLMTEYRAALPKVSKWNNYEKLDFTLGGRAALLVKPATAAPGRPWIWRTEFFGHQPQADIALLGKGFHLAYLDVRNLYGAPAAIKAMDAFYNDLTRSAVLSPKLVLEGFSRGGLFAFNWAAHRPHCVAALYVDAPVCDFKSWPGGKGEGPGSPKDWARLLKVHGFTEEQALAYGKNPVENLAPLAAAGIPILAVVGSADEIVPVAENIDLVETRYQKLGGSIQVIRKPGGKHHPHSLPDPTPIVDFALRSYTGMNVQH